MTDVITHLGSSFYQIYQQPSVFFFLDLLKTEPTSYRYVMCGKYNFQRILEISYALTYYFLFSLYEH